MDPTVKTISSWKSFGGKLGVYDHDSVACGCTMRFAVYLPPHVAESPRPVLWYLSGLTCTWANVMEKSGLQRVASELGLVVVAPDTSPRGSEIADDAEYDLGQGAGFYLTATQAPWKPNYRMDHYLTQELSALVAAKFPVRMDRQGITGHSMGGHGALTLHLKHPEVYRSVSAFAPIVAPREVPWGQKALSAYLGDDRTRWSDYDACALVERQPSPATILIDQGDLDPFLESQLRPEQFQAACQRAGQSLKLRMQPGYDHGYYFIASFIEDHLRHHAAALG